MYNRSAFAVRPERMDQPAEVSAIAALLERAYGETIQRRLVEAMRRDVHYRPGASLLATIDGEVVGYVIASGAGLGDGTSVRPIVSLAPLAVAADRRGLGIGGALIEAAVAAVDDGATPMLVVEGDPRYFQQHGFEPGPSLGICSDLADTAAPGSPLVRRLRGYDPTARGTVSYPPPFRDTLLEPDDGR